MYLDESVRLPISTVGMISNRDFEMRKFDLEKQSVCAASAVGYPQLQCAHRKGKCRQRALTIIPINPASGVIPQKRLTFGIRCSARFRITVFHISLLTLYRAIVTKSIIFVLHFFIREQRGFSVSSQILPREIVRKQDRFGGAKSALKELPTLKDRRENTVGDHLHGRMQDESDTAFFRKIPKKHLKKFVSRAIITSTSSRNA